VVEIQGTAPTVQSDNAEISVGLDTRTVRELPVIDQNDQELVGLQPGVTPPAPALDFVTDPDRNRFYSTNGQLPYLNQYYNGAIWNTEPYRNTAIRVLPEETIQQMNITTANFPAEKSFTGGAYVVNNTRGGTNGWHGSLFENWSGNVLRSRSFFDTVDNG